jgi:hypothetical protein
LQLAVGHTEPSVDAATATSALAEVESDCSESEVEVFIDGTEQTPIIRNSANSFEQLPATSFLTPSFFTAVASVSNQEVDSSDSEGEVEVFLPEPPLARSFGAQSAVPSSLKEQPPQSVPEDLDDFDFETTVELQAIASQELFVEAPPSSSASPAAAPTGTVSKALPAFVATSSAIGQSLVVRTCPTRVMHSSRCVSHPSYKAIEEGSSECTTPVSTPSKCG